MSNKDKYTYEMLLDKSKFYTIKEFTDIYGPKYRVQIANALVVKDHDLFKKYKKENLISIPEYELIASKNLLIDLINNKGMFLYLISNINNISGIMVEILEFDNKGNLLDNIVISKVDLVRLLNKLNPSEIKTITFLPMLEGLTTVKSLQKKYHEQIRTFYIDGELIEEKVINLINILLMSDEEFEYFLKNNPRKKELCYMLVDFIERERILNKYILSDEQYRRYQSIKDNKSIDKEAINKDLKMKDRDSADKGIIDKISLNQELIDYLYQDMPQTYSSIEKVIYIYLKLIDLFVFNQDKKELLRIDYKDSKILEINKFILIMAKLIDNLKISYKLSNNIYENDVLYMRIDEYLLEIKPIMTNITTFKIEDLFININLKNQNEETRKKFKELVFKIFAEQNENILKR